MAAFAKKLRIINSSGTQQTCEIYGTASEAGSNYMYATVDGQQGYISLVSTSSPLASSGRVLKSGTTYAIGYGYGSSVAYGYDTLTTAGSGTYTPRAGVYRLRVTCVGGGAGGASGFTLPSGSGGSCSSPAGTAVTSIGGGRTTFGSVSASGGTSIIIGTYTYGCQECSGSGENCQYCYSSTCRGYVMIQRSNGYHNGTISTSRDGVGGGAAVPLVNKDGTTIFSAGYGGYCDSGNTSMYAPGCTNHASYVHSGASGYRSVAVIDCVPGVPISYTVGGGGNWCRGGAYYNYEWGTSGHHGSPGGTGGILIEYGSGIQ